ncbi:LruC domain-containing protein [Anaeromyxobacter oryzae]|uniref:DUF4842 domain-containing protein n=1 Tax=Anaeromyxobacter oryzae TaxID=2918170 RepID=A0ABM7WZU2_9BACT|nr:LruC domain-containing protein [Anaeromyxobacter oryzae]BDG05064.1 hypothetical protein AMOR_40600 [Anaeromyxobacter oryzae]
MGTSKYIALVVLACAGTALAADTDNDQAADSSDAFPCDSRYAGVSFAPAKGDFGVLLFEDMWPRDGDRDFNDVVLAYNYAFALGLDGDVRAIQLNLTVLAAGASLHNAVLLRLPNVPATAAGRITKNVSGQGEVSLSPEPGEQDLVIRLVPDITQLFPVVGFANTVPGSTSLPVRPVNVIIELNGPVQLELGYAPFDLFIARDGDDGHQIHLPAYPGTARMDAGLFGTENDRSDPKLGIYFVNERGLPFALHIPTLVAWAAEGVSLDKLYPDIVAFAASGGTRGTDWYVSNVSPGYAWTATDSQPKPSLIGPGLGQACPP